MPDPALPAMLDLAVFQRAVERGIPTAGLETMEAQLGMLGTIPEVAIDAYLRSSLLPSTGGA
ncbi:MAG TPA: hypothetical protein PL196_00520, partial [Burkholderiaceae bacterium]|nr:hypothetical protein [Burkholderiaceae bacterium]